MTRRLGAIPSLLDFPLFFPFDRNFASEYHITSQYANLWAAKDTGRNRIVKDGAGRNTRKADKVTKFSDKVFILKKTITE